MGLLLLLAASLGAARAAVPVTLPAGEPTTAWTEAARLAGVQIGVTTGTPRASILAQGTRWHVQVVARDGTRHSLTVPAPRDAAAREDLLATIVSLAEPVRATLPTVALPPVPVVKPAPPPVKRAPPKPPALTPQQAMAPVSPVPTDTSDTSVTTADVSPALPPEPPVEAAPEVPPAPPEAPAPAPEPAVADVSELPLAPPPALVDLDAPEPPARLPLHLRLSTGAVVRLDASPVPSLALAGGVGIGPVRVGLGVAATLPATLVEARTMRAADLAVVVEAGDRGPWGAVRAGLAVRGWAEEGVAVATTFTPTARVDAGWGFPLGPTRIRPGIWAAADLAPTTLYVAGVAEGRLGWAFFGADLGIEINRPGK